MMTSSGMLHCRRLLLLVPSHAGHLEPTRVLLGSLLLRVVDLHRASLRLIVGDDAEKALFELQLRLAGTSIARSSAADAQTFALEAMNHSVLYYLCSAAPRAPPPSERVAHGLRSYTPSTTPVLCASGLAGNQSQRQFMDGVNQSINQSVRKLID